jgi:hypothetical protein
MRKADIASPQYQALRINLFCPCVNLFVTGLRYASLLIPALIYRLLLNDHCGT